MTISNILYTIIIGPLKLLFEVVYTIAYYVTGSAGLSIVFLSLAINFLVLPLYRRADTIQNKQNTIEKKLKPGINHIKKTFKGDERYMMIQAYYRENNYKPTDALKGSISLLLQIPFFMAAYDFLSNLNVVKGASFGPILNLGAPDTLLTIGTITLNILPILMTLINIISSIIYTKGQPLKTKAQLYLMALAFLVFLYNRPSGLVFYWTLNNVFSLGKNVVTKILKLDLKKTDNKEETYKPKVFFAATIFLALFIGLYIPTNVIYSSPSEFVNSSTLTNPISYIISSLCLGVGTFALWFNIYYLLMPNKIKKILSIVFVSACFIAVIDYMFFGTDLGNMSANLQFDIMPSFSIKDKLINSSAAIVVLLIVLLLRKYLDKIVLLATIMCIGILAFSTKQMADINKQANNTIEYQNSLKNNGDSSSKQNYISISKEGDNIIIIYLDRAVGYLVPYVLQERLELLEQFAGFTFYPNTISYASCTFAATPSLFGGYEYTPEAMNKRSDTTIIEKSAEAVERLPKIFDNKGYNVSTVSIPIDRTIVANDPLDENNYFNLHNLAPSYKLDGIDYDKYLNGKLERNLFCYSLMKVSPIAIQSIEYNSGLYLSLDIDRQVVSSMYNSFGIDSDFISLYSILFNIRDIFKITDSGNSFTMFYNSITHTQNLLQEPNYTISETVDNSSLHDGGIIKTSLTGDEIELTTDEQVLHYHAYIASFIELGKFMDYLRAEDAYDNSKIIITADHGFGLGLDEKYIDKDTGIDTMFFNPLLLVKDYNSKEFSIDETKMSNADVPYIACNELQKPLIDPNEKVAFIKNVNPNAVDTEFNGIWLSQDKIGLNK